MAQKRNLSLVKGSPSGAGSGAALKVPEPQTSKLSGGWYAALSLETSYSKPVSAEDKELLEKARQRVASSKISGDARTRLLEYVKLSQDPKGGRFSVVHAEAIANNYADGALPEEQLDFEVRLMRAWCGGTMREFIESERSSLTKKGLSEAELGELDKMLDLALTRSPMLLAVAVSTLRVYYPVAGEAVRMDMLAKMINILESASPASIQ